MTDSYEEVIPFIKTYKHIQLAAGFYSLTDDSMVALLPVDKDIYSYMLDRQILFARSKGMVHFESQETISKQLEIARSTAVRSLEKFIQHGVVVAAKKYNRAGGLEHWEYTGVVHPLRTYKSVWKDGKKTGEIVDLSWKANSINPIKSPTASSRVITPRVMLLDDDPDVPEWAK